MSQGKLGFTELQRLLREDGYLTNGQASELAEKLLPYINPTPAVLTDGQLIDLIIRATAQWVRRDNDLLYLAVAHAVLREAAPAGLKLVPIEPTPAMVQAYLAAVGRHRPYDAMDPAIVAGYKAMIKAAQEKA